MIDRAIGATIMLHMKQTFSRSMFKFIMLASPVFSGLIFGLIYKDSSNYNMVAFVMVGTATTTMWNSICFSSAGDINRERFMGALEKLFLVPVPFIHLMSAKVIANTILGVISMLISFIFVILAFRVPFSIQNPMLFTIASLVMIVSYGILGLLLSGLLAISRKTALLMNIIGFPIFILTGAVFPVEILPPGVRWLSFLLTPTYGIKLIRYSIAHDDTGSTINSISGSFNGDVLKSMTALVFLTIVYAILASRFYKYMNESVRKKATLEIY